ncbi:MAG TPA: hypothetical protein VF510_10680 [Ktedonobacterales bacterium]
MCLTSGMEPQALIAKAYPSNLREAEWLLVEPPMSRTAMVERTLAWWGGPLRLSKDNEYQVESSEALIYMGMSHLMLQRMIGAGAFPAPLNDNQNSRLDQGQGSGCRLSLRAGSGGLGVGQHPVPVGHRAEEVGDAQERERQRHNKRVLPQPGRVVDRPGSEQEHTADHVVGDAHGAVAVEGAVYVPVVGLRPRRPGPQRQLDERPGPREGRHRLHQQVAARTLRRGRRSAPRTDPASRWRRARPRR